MRPYKLPLSKDEALTLLGLTALYPEDEALAALAARIRGLLEAPDVGRRSDTAEWLTRALMHSAKPRRQVEDAARIDGYSRFELDRAIHDMQVIVKDDTLDLPAEVLELIGVQR